jgi:multidrug efflux pump subunit AcrA (membrane-fusion protein)
MKNRWIWLALILAGALAGFRIKFTPVPVETHEIQPEEVLAEAMGTGSLEARVKTTISPRIQERLAQVLVDQNDVVAEGQLLAQLDDRELRGQVEVAAAALAAAAATENRVHVDEARAQAIEEQTRQEHKRVAELVATKVSSQSQLDKAIEQLRVAESELQRAHAATLEAHQQVLTAESNLAYQKERLDFTRIRSPYDGLVVRRYRDPGGVVVPGSSLLQIVSTNEIWVSAWVDETAAAALREGQPARVVFRSQPARSYAGEVARLGRETDRETREFLVDVRVRELPPNWTLGQRAEVFIVTARKAAVATVPPRFVEWREGKPGVFVDRRGKAEWRHITLGLTGRERVEVSSGLSAGDKVAAPKDPKRTKLSSGQRMSQL